MNSHITKDFRKSFDKLPKRIQAQSRIAYRLWKSDPHHSSLQFKRVGLRNPIYSVRVGIGWRALGVVSGANIIWYWIGSHEEYNNLIKRI